MSLAINLRTAARNLIDTFGNTGTLYTFSTATKTSSDEGDETITAWGTTPASIKIVDGGNIKEQLIQMGAGLESVGNDEKVARDDATIAINDRITVDSVDYRIVEIKSIRVQDTVIIQVIKVERVDSTTAW